MTEPTPVEIEEIRSRPTVIKLADGAVIEIQMYVSGIDRLDNLPNGEASYSVKNKALISVVQWPHDQVPPDAALKPESPPHLKPVS